MDAPLPDGLVEAWEEFLSKPRDVSDLFNHDLLFPLQRRREWESMMAVAKHSNPRVVLDVGSDKGGGLWLWLKAHPGIRRMAACEIRGTPYAPVFERTFPHVDFLWLPCSSYDQDTVLRVAHWLRWGQMCTPERADQLPNPEGMGKFDCSFLDGDKSWFLRDFNCYLCMMRRPGVTFMHDVQDEAPFSAFRQASIGRNVTMIVDQSEGLTAKVKGQGGVPPNCAYEGWLRHWEGRSCGVGVIILEEGKL